jgi:hypothetical protein
VPRGLVILFTGGGFSRNSDALARLVAGLITGLSGRVCCRGLRMCAAPSVVMGSNPGSWIITYRRMILITGKVKGSLDDLLNLRF